MVSHNKTDLLYDKKLRFDSIKEDQRLRISGPCRVEVSGQQLGRIPRAVHLRHDVGANNA